MSRSNPSNTSANPSTIWLEWKGGEGKLTRFNKETKENEEIPLPFRFMVLDQLSTVTGYNSKLKKGILSNEVRDVRADTMHVRFHKGDDIAVGKWSDIKEKVNFKEGSFATSCYIAYKDGDVLKIGNIRISGSALGPWIEFKNAAGKDIDTKGVLMDAGKETTAGRVTFIPPTFCLIDIKPETDEQAKDLDRTLQEYLKGYLAKPKSAGGSDRLPGEEDYSQEPPPDYPEPEPDSEDLNKAIPKDTPADRDISF